MSWQQKMKHMLISTYSSRPDSVYQWHVHSRAVVFHNLHRGQRDTRLCTLISYRLLRCTLTFDPPRESSITSLHHSSPPYPSAVAAAASSKTVRSIPTCSIHCIPTCVLGALSNPSHRYNSDRVAMYCATVFWRRLIYSSTIKTPDSSRAIASKVYFHIPFVVIHRSRPVSRLATWA